MAKAKSSGIVSLGDRIRGMVPLTRHGKRGATEKRFRDGSTYDDLAKRLGEESIVYLEQPTHIVAATEGSLRSIAQRVQKALRDEKRGENQLPNCKVVAYPKGTEFANEETGEKFISDNHCLMVVGDEADLVAD